MFGQINQDIKIKQLIVVERPGYEDQYIRSYQLDINYNTLNALENMIDKKKHLGINNIKGVDISMTIPDAMMPSSNPSSKGIIAKGWGEKRALFMLEATLLSSTGYSETVFYIQGYTEYWDVSFGGSMPDEMKFYINSLMVLQRTINPQTKVIHSRVTDNFSVIQNNDGTTTTSSDSFFNKPVETSVVARPDDILYSITQVNMLGMDKNSGLTVMPSTILNLDGDNSNEPVLVDRTKASTPMSHISSTMSGIMQAQSGADIGYNDLDVYDHAATITRTKNIEDIPFMRKITEIHGLNTTAYFTLDDINKIDFTFNKDKFFIFKGSSPYRKPNESQLFNGDTTHTYSPTEENRIVVLISTTLSTYMAEAGLLYIMLSITNKNGLPEVIPLGGNTLIEGLNLKDMLSRVVTRVQNELVPIITRQNMQMVEILVDIDLLGNSVITISINGNNPETINIPTAMDSATSPIITDSGNFNNLINGYKAMGDTITLASSN